MKKIIAMLLCVAMIAAFAVNAFAAVTVAQFASGLSVKAPATIAKELYDKASAPKTGTAALAAQLAAAKKTYSDAVDAYNKLLGNVANAAKAAQYDAVASYYNAANAILDIQVQSAVATFAGQAMYDTYKAVADEFYEAVGYDTPYAYMAAAWPSIFG